MVVGVLVALSCILHASLAVRTISPSFAPAAVCRNVPGLSRAQLTLCKKRAPDTAAALEGLRAAATECQHQFRFSRWNCSQLGQRKPMSSVLLQRVHDDKSQSSSSTTQSSNHSDIISRIVSKCETTIQNHLRANKFIDIKDRKNIAAKVADYMVDDLKDYRRSTAERISQKFCDVYPEAFGINIGGIDLKSAVETLRQQVYTAVNYRKGVQKRKLTLSSSIEMLGDIEDYNDEPIAKVNKQDQYGCVAYLPNLPVNETLDSQNTKMLKLADYHKSSVICNDEIRELMKCTYYLQRRCIHKIKDIVQIFNDWPYLSDLRVFICHADELLGKNILETWQQALNHFSRPINIYSRNKEIESEMKNKNVEAETYIRNLIKQAKIFSTSLKNMTPLLEITFPCIIKFMKEDGNYLYCFVNEELSNEEILTEAPALNPVLIIRGFRESAFAHAITAAGVVHSVSRACSQGRLVNCGCAPSAGHHKKWLTGAQRWKWGGCGHDVNYGMEFSRLFLDGKEPGDIRARIAGHNNQAGRLAVSNNMQIRCKCHGMSGSCELKTCWRVAPDIRQIGKILKNRFRSALMVDQSNLGNGSPIIITSKPRARKQNLKPRAKTKRRGKYKRDITTELLYYQKSPNFCERDPAMEVLGTNGRVCNKTSEGYDGCASLCCGRGYNMVKRRRNEQCNCKFHWCCKVECENCIIEEWIPICK